MSIDFAQEWIKHDGTGCPFEPGTLVKHMHRCGMACEEVIEAEDLRTDKWCVNGCWTASLWGWAINGRPAFFADLDITGYKLVKPLDEELYREADTRVGEPA